MDTHPAPHPTGGRGLARALGLGSLFCLLIGVGAPYSTYLLRGSYMDLDFSTPAAVFLLFVIGALLNPALRLLGRRRVLAPGEIILIYAMMIVACALSTMGMAAQLVPTIAAARYYAQTQTAWPQHVLPYLKPWLLPDAHASERLFTGLKAGESIPWAAWLAPLAVWGVLLLALYTASICLMAILRRQWVERERLAYPLTQLPMEFARTGAFGSEKPLLRDTMMWLGFAAAFSCAGVRGLHHYFPSFPNFDPLWQIPSFRDTLSFTIRISFPMIAFFFLANPEAVFSLWVFNRLAWAGQGWMNILGTQYRADLGPYSGAPLFGHLAVGGFFALTFATLRAAWPHLRLVGAAAMGRACIDDAHEPMAYRAAVWLMVISVVMMAIWLALSGMPLFALPVFLLGVLAAFLAMTRIVIESGMAEAVPPSVPAGFTYAVLGSQVVGAHGTSALSLTYIWAGDMRTLVMTSAAHGYRLSDALPGRPRALTWAMFLSIAITAPAAILTTLYLAYTRGGVGLNDWFFINGPQWPFKWIAERNANPLAPSFSGWMLMGAGGVFGVFLAVMRQRYVWWPFHPVGFAIAPTWIMNEIWANAFIAWLARGLVVRYAGLRGYRRIRPCFLGLIFGQFTANGFWLILDSLTGARGNQIFWI